MKKVKSLEKVITPGMFVYDDGLISAEIIPDRQITSVVGAIIGRRVLGVCLQATILPWSSDFLEVGTTNISSGFEATQKILAAAKEQGEKAEAAEWCAKYAQNGVKAGEAFLPSRNEWIAIQANEKSVNRALRKVKAIVLDDGGWCWSSTEGCSYSSWKLYVGNGNNNYDYKYCNHYVRPILAFEL